MRHLHLSSDLQVDQRIEALARMLSGKLRIMECGCPEPRAEPREPRLGIPRHDYLKARPD